MSFIDELPEGRTIQELEARGNMIVDAVGQGNGQFEWWGVPVRDSAGNELIFYIMRDALQIDGVRVSVSATDAQRIGDYIEAMLPTPLMTDLAWEVAYKIPPQPQLQPVQDGTMAFTNVMAAYSKIVDELTDGHEQELVADTGKYWVLTNGLLTSHSGGPPGVVAANYGWHTKGSSGELAVSNQSRVIQGVGYRHDRSHVDYSQQARLVSIYATLNGQPAFLPDILRDPSNARLARLVSHEGTLSLTRQPGVDPVLGTEATQPPVPDWPAGGPPLTCLNPEGGTCGSILATVGKALVVVGLGVALYTVVRNI